MRNKKEIVLNFFHRNWKGMFFTLFFPVIFFLYTEFPQFTSYIETYSYVGILLWYLTFDNILPIPQEISLMIIGYLSSNGFFNPAVAGAIALIGFLTIDVLYFLLSKSGSKIIDKLKKYFKIKLIDTIQLKLQKQTAKTYFILCFIPRGRFLGPIAMGLSKIPLVRFLTLDVFFLSFFIAIYLSLGFFFYKVMLHLIDVVQKKHHLIFMAFIVLLTIILLWLSNKMKNVYLKR